MEEDDITWVVDCVRKSVGNHRQDSLLEGISERRWGFRVEKGLHKLPEGLSVKPDDDEDDGTECG